MLDLPSDTSDSTCLMVNQHRSFPFHMMKRQLLTQKTVRSPTLTTRIIAKTQFRVPYLSIPSMNSHYYCKNGHSPLGFPANGTSRDGRYNRAFHASRRHS
ncbi:hypothetical protein BN2476_1150026 [Paraburkholderia piptadeniae]|uniref:Uncharacterized protein n=1 Tax=Paraburkholderia piptadeniae TaxID=1701573 RepID=A0A1N7SV06_9BURK|nr:hypothetical protein BN2476_1150026 [Paraburkholderia piptadeniae]